MVDRRVADDLEQLGNHVLGYDLFLVTIVLGPKGTGLVGLPRSGSAAADLGWQE